MANRTVDPLWPIRFTVRIIETMVTAWALMIVIGIFHAETLWPPKTIGYWPCVPIAILIYVILARAEVTEG